MADTPTRDPGFASFQAISKQLFGDVFDPRELWQIVKTANDSPDVHIDGDGKKKHSNTARALVLGGAAEGVATYRAGQEAHKVLNSPALKEAKTVGAKLKAVSRGGKVGEFGLQAANLGVGLVAARELARHAKTQPVAKGLRVKKVAMSAEQLADWGKVRSKAGTTGQRALLGGTAVAAFAAGHHLGRKRNPAAPPETEPVAKAAFRVKPLNAAAAPRVVSLKARRPAGPPPLAKSVYREIPEHAQHLAHVRATAGRHRVAKAAFEKASSEHAAAVEAAYQAGVPVKELTEHSAYNSLAAVYNVALKRAGKGGNRYANRYRQIGDDSVSKSGPELTWTGEISKVDEDKRQVFGWCSLSTVDGQPVVDLQGDFVPLDEIEKSAYKYVIESRKGGDMHRRVGKGAWDTDQPLHTSDLIESFVVTPQKLAGMGLPSDALPHGWWVGFKVNDEAQWAKVKSGERTGFSIHGTGQRTPAAA